MTELYPNISNELRQATEAAWNIALHKRNPVEAAQFLNNITEYYRTIGCSEEEMSFIRFYFNMKMETYKNE